MLSSAVTEPSWNTSWWTCRITLGQRWIKRGQTAPIRHARWLARTSLNVGISSFRARLITMKHDTRKTIMHKLKHLLACILLYCRLYAHIPGFKCISKILNPCVKSLWCLSSLINITTWLCRNSFTRCEMSQSRAKSLKKGNDAKLMVSSSLHFSNTQPRRRSSSGNA